MKATKILMGMPITVEVVDKCMKRDIDRVYKYFDYVDKKFSTYKKNSEITKFNEGKIAAEDFSKDMKTVFALCMQTKRETGGYFDIEKDGFFDPSGLVKGWSVYNAAKILGACGYKNYYVEAGGDIEAVGVSAEGKPWRVGIRNPFDINEIVKVVEVTGLGVATSGTYIRGQHVYNPLSKNSEIKDIVSITVIGPNIYEADRFATAAFAMGEGGINFIESRTGFEGYMINKDKVATMTTGFEGFITN